MMRALYSGVTGLKLHEMKMGVIGNNIANINTVGFKAGRITFQELLSHTLRQADLPRGGRGGINPMQLGMGVGVGTIDVNHTAGSLQSTGLGTDLAIMGDGFFILNEGDDQYYTRVGTFGLDREGDVINNSNGFKVQGWNADWEGNINTNSPVRDINLRIEELIPSRASTEVEYAGNLNALRPPAPGDFRVIEDTRIDATDTDPRFEFWFEEAIGGELRIDLEVNGVTDTIIVDHTADAAAIQAAIATHAGLASPPLPSPATVSVAGAGTEASPWVVDIANLTDGYTIAISRFDRGDLYRVTTVSEEMIVYDSQGERHNLNMTFTRLTDNEWEVKADGPYGLEMYDRDGVLVTEWIVEFDEDGRYYTDDVGYLTFSPTGADRVEIVPDFSVMTQYAYNFDVNAISTDGYETGSLDSFSIDNSGVILGIYSNGLTRELGQVALASFSNPAGLRKEGDTLFESTTNSGRAKIGPAGFGGRGIMSPGDLEMSNVDLSDQFTEMMTTQRGFQANTRTITTTDQILQELVNLIR